MVVVTGSTLSTTPLLALLAQPSLDFITTVYATGKVTAGFTVYATLLTTVYARIRMLTTVCFYSIHTFY